MIRKILLLLLVIVYWNNVLSQSVNLSQNIINKTFLNPALTGLSNEYLVNIAIRQHFYKIKSFETYSIAFETPFSKKNNAIGFSVISDKQANNLMQTIKFSLIYAQKFKINYQNFISFALQTSFSNSKINTNSLVFADMIDAKYGSIYSTQESLENSQNNSYLSISLGSVFFNKNFNIGLNINNLTNISNKKDEYPNAKYTLHSSLKKKLNKLIFHPTLIIDYQKPSSQISIGTYIITKKNIVTAILLKNNYKPQFNNIQTLLGYKFKDFIISYSYDFNLNQKKSYFTSIHELNLKINLHKNKNLYNNFYIF